MLWRLPQWADCLHSAGRRVLRARGRSTPRQNTRRAHRARFAHQHALPAATQPNRRPHRQTKQRRKRFERSLTPQLNKSSKPDQQRSGQTRVATGPTVRPITAHIRTQGCCCGHVAALVSEVAQTDSRQLGRTHPVGSGARLNFGLYA